MVVLVLTACPAGLRGFLTRWLMEISPGVFVGKLSARVRDEVWDRVQEMAKDGRGILVFAADTEQGLDFRVHRHDWVPVDVDGLLLMRRPAADDGPDDPNVAESSAPPTGGQMRKGWSKASQRRRAARRNH